MIFRIFPIIGIFIVTVSLFLPVEKFLLAHLGRYYGDSGYYVSRLSDGVAWFRVSLVLIGIILTALPKIFRSSGEESEISILPVNTELKNFHSLALIIAAAGLIMRIPGITRSLWYDEIYAYRETISWGLTAIFTDLYYPNNHIFYSLLSFFSVKWLGFYEWSYRLPALLFGAGGIYMLALLGRRLFNRRIGFSAAVFLAVSACHMRYSQEARGYSAMVFFALAAVFLFIECWEKNRLRWWAAWSIVNILGIYTHIYMVFVFLGQVLYPVIRAIFSPKDVNRRVYPNRFRRLMGSALLVGGISFVLYSIPLPLLINYHHKVKQVGGLDISLAARRLAEEFLPAGSLIRFFLLLFFGVGLWGDTAKNKGRLLFLFLPFLLSLAAVIIFRPDIYARFFSFFLPVYLLYIAVGVDRLASLILRGVPALGRFVPTAVMTGSVVALCLPSMMRVYRLPKQDFKSAARYVADRWKPDSKVVFWGLGGKEFQHYYPEAQALWGKTAPSLSLSPVVGETWLLYSYPQKRKDLSSLGDHYQLEKVFRGFRPEMDIYIRRGGGEAKVK